MSHVAFVPFTGFRIREEAMLELGMTLPGLRNRSAAIAQLPALGLLTLAGMMPAGWSCSYHETSHWNECVVDEIMRERPTLIALSALTASVEEAYRFSMVLRREGVPVVLGGLHATTCPDEARQYCDAVVIGEGEPVWHDLLADVQMGSMKPIYRSSAAFGLSQTPVPRFDLLGSRARPRFTVQTQRGCPFACDFCAASRLLGPFREKPLANLRAELEAIRTLDPHPLLELADDNTFAGTRDVGPFFDLLDSVNARYFTEADWRIGERADVLEGLAASGCVQVLVGIESLVFRHAGMGTKEAELSRIMKAIDAIQEAGVAVIGCFIVGCDGESCDSLERLARFVEASSLADVQLTLQTPFPGTALYRRLRRDGRLLPKRGWAHYTLFDLTYRPDLLSVEELERGFENLVRRLFSRENAERRNRLRRQIWQRHPRFRTCASEPGSAI